MVDAENQRLQANLRILQDKVENAGDEEKALLQVSRDMESLFVRMLLDSMDKTVPRGEDSWDNSQAMQTWRGMLNEKLADTLGESSPIGIAGMIYRQLSEHMERHMEVPSAGAAESGAVSPPAAPKIENTGQSQPAAASSGSSQSNIGELKELIQQSASDEGVDPALVAAMITQESGGDAQAVSPAGARGLMQLMPATARMLGVEDVFDPQQNISGGVKYISQLLERFGGDEKLALAAYNAGPGTVDRYGGVPPYRETMNYVDRVASLKDSYRKMGY